MWCVVYPDELYHHGIKGQKWGVRRFQNPDGTLTEAGKKRYNDDGTPKKKKTINGKKIAAAVGATAAVAITAGIAFKYRKEIGKAVSDMKGEVALKAIDAGAKHRRDVGKAIDRLKEKAVFNAVDIIADDETGKLAKAVFMPKQLAKEYFDNGVKRIGKAGEKGVDAAIQALFTAPLSVAAGYGIKKIQDNSNKAKQKKGRSYPRDVRDAVATKGLNAFNNALGNNPGKNKQGKQNNGNGKKYSQEDEKRYSRLFQNPNVVGNDAVKAKIRKMRDNGDSVDEIEEYVNGL